MTSSTMLSSPFRAVVGLAKSFICAPWLPGPLPLPVCFWVLSLRPDNTSSICPKASCLRASRRERPCSGSGRPRTGRFGRSKRYSNDALRFYFIGHWLVKRQRQRQSKDNETIMIVILIIKACWVMLHSLHKKIDVFEKIYDRYGMVRYLFIQQISVVLSARQSSVHGRGSRLNISLWRKKSFRRYL